MSRAQLRVDVPPDVDVEDRVVGPLTFRHLGYLACAGGGAAAALLHPGPVSIAVGTLLVLVGLVGACWRPQGRPLDGWLAPAWAYRKRTRGSPRDDSVPELTGDEEQPVDPKPASGPLDRLRVQCRRLRPYRPNALNVTCPQLPCRRRLLAAGSALAVAAVVATVATSREPHQAPPPNPAKSVPSPVAPPLPPPTTTPPTTTPPTSEQPPAVPPTGEEIDDAVDALFDWLTGT